jgi:CheY-like chemotaxis protein
VTQLVNLVANALVIEEKKAVPIEEKVAVPIEEKVAVPAEAVAVPAKAVTVPAEAVPVTAGGGQPEALPLSGRTLVVADDEPDQVTFLATVFEDHGATVVQATDGDEALAAVRSTKPDLLTLDLEMPGLDVGDVFETLRKDPEFGNLKICIITGRPELRKLIYDRSVRVPEGYLDKPVTEETLVRTIRKILEVSHEA